MAASASASASAPTTTTATATTTPTFPKKPQVVFVLGGPGAGKGTQCALIKQHYGFEHLSAGDLLRAEQASGSALAQQIEKHIKEGSIVPVEITVNLLRNAINRSMAAGKHYFLVDGFPRNQDNMDGWNKIMGEQADVRFCLFFDCSEQVMQGRLMQRSQTSGRADDNLTSIMKRFQTYTHDTVPIIQSFAKEGKLKRINAASNPQHVFEMVQRAFAEFTVTTTYGMVKPDAVSHSDEVLKRIVAAGMDVVAQQKMTLTPALAAEFYAEHKGRHFYDNLLAFMTGGPVVCIAMRGKDAVRNWRVLCGPTNTDTARKTAPGSIRADFGTDGTKNAVHGSDSIFSANRELALIFPAALSATLVNKMAPRRLIISGAPASGKGTQCDFIKERFNVVHLSTGDLIRAAIASGSPLGKSVQSVVESGKLVPDELIINLVKEKLESKECKEQGWLLDGFPRTGPQAMALSAAGITVDAFIDIEVPDSILLDRVLGRRIDPVTGRSYHIKTAPSTDPVVTARLVQRADDTEEKIKVRLEQYHANKSAVVGFFQNVLHAVNGNQDKNLVFQAICSGVH